MVKKPIFFLKGANKFMEKEFYDRKYQSGDRNKVAFAMKLMKNYKEFYCSLETK